MSKGSGIVFPVLTALVAMSVLAAQPASNGDAVKVSAQWSEVVGVSKTVPTTQLLASKFTLRDSPQRKAVLKALRDLRTDDTRLQLWYSVVNQAVPELKEPTATETFWDFKYMDPLVADFYANTSGKHHLNIGTVPRWMFNLPSVELPTDPGASFYPYTKDTKSELLKDPSGRQFAEYQSRIFQWYTRGGFTDELGRYHKSGHHYTIDYLLVTNEPDFENRITVEQYTRIYDAVVLAIRKIDPNVQFFGPEVSGAEVPWARYFLNGKNHNPDVLPLQYFSFHNYVDTPNDPEVWQTKLFTAPAPANPTDGAAAFAFTDRIREVMKIRDELSPKTIIILDELGTFNIVKPGEDSCQNDEPYPAYNPRYWVAMGANWAVTFIAAEKLDIPLISMSQMVGYPTQCHSISMVNDLTVHPNAHYWVLSLLNDNFHPGDKLVRTESSSPEIVAQASITPRGRKILLVNTTNRAIIVDVATSFATAGIRTQVVDDASGEQPPRKERKPGNQIALAPFATAVISEGAK